MAKEGWWINYSTGKKVEVDDHENWIRDAFNAKKIGVPPAVQKKFKNYDLHGQDHTEFLLYILKNTTLMRVRGHGASTTFEYASSSRRDPMDAIWEFCSEHSGDYTWIDIWNYNTGEHYANNWGEMRDLADSGGYEAIMRKAGRFNAGKFARLLADRRGRTTLVARKLVADFAPGVEKMLAQEVARQDKILNQHGSVEQLVEVMKRGDEAAQED